MAPINLLSTSTAPARYVAEKSASINGSVEPTISIGSTSRTRPMGRSSPTCRAGLHCADSTCGAEMEAYRAVPPHLPSCGWHCRRCHGLVGSLLCRASGTSPKECTEFFCCCVRCSSVWHRVDGAHVSFLRRDDTAVPRQQRTAEFRRCCVDNLKQMHHRLVW